MEQIRIVLTEFGIRVTPIQLTEICTKMGYREGQMIKYFDLLAQFTSRSDDGIVHGVLTNKDQRYARLIVSGLKPCKIILLCSRLLKDDPRRACTSLGDVERRLVSLLQDKFLKLLAEFKLVLRV